MAGKGEGPAIGIDLGTKYSCGMEMAEMEMEMEECSFVVSSDPHRLIDSVWLHCISSEELNMGQLLMLL
ncbi:Heat shock cognate 70 kDa protein [Cucumis melo var. makuwa]|uniref:Heat shock cognate 70 kDa protein n=1 Tax=Cucumis melo var. makuwa TaxID=1194695 RepID=A0A5A7U956_CUCMM|nr:Heat shock cognate 70 kDa protein [Cucumis melo var. makuwa]